MVTAGRKISLWRRVTLPASLILNLFLVALIGGHLLHHRGNQMNAGTPLVRALARAEASLPPQDATAFGAVIRRDEPKYAAAQQQMADARRELQNQITTESFDSQKVRHALAAWTAAWNHFLEDFSGTLVEALSHISPEGRRKLIAARRSPP